MTRLFIHRAASPSKTVATTMLSLLLLLSSGIATRSVASASMMSSSPQLSTMATHPTNAIHRRRHRHQTDVFQTGTKNQSSIFSPRNTLSRIMDIRGGDVGDSAPENNNYGYANDGALGGQPPQPQQQPPQPQPQPQQMAQSAPPPNNIAGTTMNDPMMYGYRETVEDRIDAWRRQQQQLQQSQSADEAASVVDEQGRFKLFTTVSRVSVSFFFFILMWRTVHHYELADATFGHKATKAKGSLLLRTIIVTPLVVLFLGEMMGAILGLAGGSANTSKATKKRLKGILNLHKFVELIMIVYNVVRLAVWPSKYVMREVYIGRTISNFFFLMQAQLYTKLSWDDVGKNTIGETGYVSESYYDDYTPEMTNNYYDDDDFSSWQSSSTNGSANYYGEENSAPLEQQQWQQQQQQQQHQQSYNENTP
eukprot:CAMPEP_0183745162 /NCGR_PEP_ID=MMETSP0737-20130205/66102_1 /TAXON_ID=385413 /ORGANISM="Thalassiosira miniscula, Strain CCMP1093" /LENGTH=421 /DNA_ID=CAMNT_0025980821 /DNA_START=9 /DNA_END=1274 /DNA_ORIENTATION=-